MNAPDSPFALPESSRAAAALLGIDLPLLLDSFCDRVDLYEQVLRGVARETVTLPDQVRALMASNDLEAARRCLHTFKGLSGTVGLQQVSQLAAMAEKAVPTPQAGEAQDALWQALAEAQPLLFALLGNLKPLARQQAAQFASD